MEPKEFITVECLEKIGFKKTGAHTLVRGDDMITFDATLTEVTSIMLLHGNSLGDLFHEIRQVW